MIYGVLVDVQTEYKMWALAIMADMGHPNRSKEAAKQLIVIH